MPTFAIAIRQTAWGECFPACALAMEVTVRLLPAKPKLVIN